MMDPVDLLLLISELEGSFTYCKRLGFYEDMTVLEEMKGRYYKMYFKLKKQQGK